MPPPTSSHQLYHDSPRHHPLRSSSGTSYSMRVMRNPSLPSTAMSVASSGNVGKAYAPVQPASVGAMVVGTAPPSRVGSSMLSGLRMPMPTSSDAPSKRARSLDHDELSPPRRIEGVLASRAINLSEVRGQTTPTSLQKEVDIFECIKDCVNDPVAPQAIPCSDSTAKQEVADRPAATFFDQSTETMCPPARRSAWTQTRSLVVHAPLTLPISLGAPHEGTPTCVSGDNTAAPTAATNVSSHCSHCANPHLPPLTQYVRNERDETERLTLLQLAELIAALLTCSSG